MARISAINGGIGGNLSPITARDKINGDDVNTTENAGFLTMPSTACGIRNQGASDITIMVVLVLSDSTNTMKVVVPAGGESVTVGLFNAVAASGSTGHAAATTEYLLA